jgi:hypothetical protein
MNIHGEGQNDVEDSNPATTVVAHGYETDPKRYKSDFETIAKDWLFYPIISHL